MPITFPGADFAESVSQTINLNWGFLESNTAGTLREAYFLYDSQSDSWKFIFVGQLG